MRTERTPRAAGTGPGGGSTKPEEAGAGEPRPGMAARVLVAMLRAYQLVVSPWFAPRCRYYPSCSQYGVVAVSRHGLVRGGAMAIWRVLRCNPWSLGGVDHVPEHTRSARTLIDSLPANSPRSRDASGGRDLT